MTPRDGIIFVATGENYVRLAVRAARSAAEACPGVPVDLFADREVSAPWLAQVHRIEAAWTRSKIDGMLASRFERTLYLDADLFVTADLRDVFEVLERFDFALAHDPPRNGEGCHAFWRRPLPAAFAQPNSGVMGFRRTEPVLALLRDWRAAVIAHGTGRDQPALRELLWESDLRVAVLPEEYNLLDYAQLNRWWTLKAAPRVIHSPHLHQHFSLDRPEVASLEALVGPAVAAKLPDLIGADRGLARLRGEAPRPPSGRLARLRRRAEIAWRLRGHLWRSWVWRRKVALGLAGRKRPSA